MSILSLNNVSLILAGNVILDQADWQIQPRDKIAVVGRNGAGKSTLLKLLQGDMVQDTGHIHRVNGLRVAGLMQDVPVDDDDIVYHFLVKSLGQLGEVLTQFYQFSLNGDLDQLARCQQKMDDLQAWDKLPLIDTMATRLNIDPKASMSQLSGGMKRRVLLAAALIATPDLLLLDEPTNHLDINAIEWLESYLKSYTGSLLLVTHDRQFLSQVANRIVEIDRGKLHRHDCDYETYLDRREAMRITEQTHFDLFDKRLSEEETWLRTGVKARRTRNEGRVRALKSMREAYMQRRSQIGKVKSMTLDVVRSGNLVLEAEHLNYSLNDQPLLRDFSFVLTRGDKVGIVGSNGCGKTTLVRLLLGELKPDSGIVRQGTSMSVAYFDQLRRQLDENQTVMANVADGADYVTIQGKQKHVASYLRDFLFAPERFNQPVSSLSGGERNRLLLAKLLAKPVNLLVLDEPTNDLDIETLELLETMLIDYPGTLLLISHDRTFINQVVTSVLINEGNGSFREHLGGYDTYHTNEKKLKKVAVTPIQTSKTDGKLTFNEQRELSKLLQQIDAVEKEIDVLHLEMSNLVVYQDGVQVQQEKLRQKDILLTQLYERWEILEAKK